MELISDLISTLNLNTAVKDVRQGPFQTAVLTRNCGLAATPHDPGYHHNRAPVTDAGYLMQKEASELAQMAQSSNPFEAAIGMATINSLLDVDRQRCVDTNGGDLLAQEGKGKEVALIGHFPFVNKLREAARCLWVIEKHPQEGDIAETEAESLIPQADVVGITGSAFINHTIDHLLGLCSLKAYVVVLGATTPLSPVLFDYGVNAIAGTKVIDPKTVLRYVSQGATFRQLKGIRLLTMKRDQTDDKI
ncbi:MAG: DUF364 domain-containing protein [Dehalococcoidia bacterium]|nr:DUF364 domain-containing protein [Dehalococcoidia bacterium]